MVAVKTSYDNVAKSEEDKRSYRALELNNGIKVGSQLTQRTMIGDCYLYIQIKYFGDNRENFPFVYSCGAICEEVSL